MRHASRRELRSAAAVATLLLVTACGVAKPPLPSELGGQSAPAEHCLDVFKQAIPDADIEITSAKSVNDSVAKATVTIEGTRDVTPSAALARDLAAECKFDHDVLMDFHWTKAPFR